MGFREFFFLFRGKVLQICDFVSISFDRIVAFEELLSMQEDNKSFIREKKLFPRVRVSRCIISPMLIRNNIQFDRNIGKNIESLDNLNNAINETNHTSLATNQSYQPNKISNKEKFLYNL